MSKPAADVSGLFRRLHEADASHYELIDRLACQRDVLKPEDIINNALRLEPEPAIEMLKLLPGSRQPIDFSSLSFHLDKIDSAIFRIKLLQYFSTVNEPKTPLIVARFLDDSNKVVVLEALKTLRQLQIEFDPSFLLRYVEAMTDVERQQALEVISRQADANLVPHLSVCLNSKFDDLNDFFADLVVRHADRAGFEKFLMRLKLEDDWCRQNAVALVQKFANDRLSEIARELIGHEEGFIRETAQALVVNLLDDEDLERIEALVRSDNWQVRERAVQNLGRSANRNAIGVLKKMLREWPEDYLLALRAVRKLGFSKGLEIAFDALKSPEPNVQRAALETVEVLTGGNHAAEVRDNLLWSLPTLSSEMTDFAKELIADLTRKFDLPSILVDETSTTEAIGVDFKVAGGVGNVQEVERLLIAGSPLDRLAPGQVWMDRYRIQQEIGRGMMGRVMLVEDDMVDENLVLKFMLPELTVDRQSTERFKREVKYARKISHRNVIRVHDLLLKDGICAISMEYFESQGLDEFLQGFDRLEIRDGLKIIYQIAAGMVAAHEQGVIHRDLKASNVLVDGHGNLKIVDFGIASAGAAVEATLTRTGSIIGSPGYLSPERAGGAEADERSDIYSLGVIAYLVFAGKLPYVGKPMEVLAQHRAGKAEPVKQVNPSVPAPVSDLVSVLMAVDPAQRVQSMVEVRDQVRKLLQSA